MTAFRNSLLALAACGMLATSARGADQPDKADPTKTRSDTTTPVSRLDTIFGQPVTSSDEICTGTVPGSVTLKETGPSSKADLVTDAVGNVAGGAVVAGGV